MTAKGKAKELYDLFRVLYPNQDAEFISVECVKISVIEILDILTTSSCFYDVNYLIDYWNEVLKEIDEL